MENKQISEIYKFTQKRKREDRNKKYKKTVGKFHL